MDVSVRSVSPLYATKAPNFCMPECYAAQSDRLSSPTKIRRISYAAGMPAGDYVIKFPDAIRAHFAEIHSGLDEVQVDLRYYAALYDRTRFKSGVDLGLRTNMKADMAFAEHIRESFASLSGSASSMLEKDRTAAEEAFASAQKSSSAINLSINMMPELRQELRAFLSIDLPVAQQGLEALDLRLRRHRTEAHSLTASTAQIFGEFRNMFSSMMNPSEGMGGAILRAEGLLRQLSQEWKDRMDLQTERAVTLAHMIEDPQFTRYSFNEIYSHVQYRVLAEGNRQVAAYGAALGQDDRMKQFASAADALKDRFEEREQTLTELAAAARKDLCETLLAEGKERIEKRLRSEVDTHLCTARRRLDDLRESVHLSFQEYEKGSELIMRLNSRLHAMQKSWQQDLQDLRQKHCSQTHSYFCKLYEDKLPADLRSRIYNDSHMAMLIEKRADELCDQWNGLLQQRISREEESFAHIRQTLARLMAECLNDSGRRCTELDSLSRVLAHTMYSLSGSLRTKMGERAFESSLQSKISKSEADIAVSVYCPWEQPALQSTVRSHGNSLRRLQTSAIVSEASDPQLPGREAAPDTNALCPVAEEALPQCTGRVADEPLRAEQLMGPHTIISKRIAMKKRTSALKQSLRDARFRPSSDACKIIPVQKPPIAQTIHRNTSLQRAISALVGADLFNPKVESSTLLHRDAGALEDATRESSDQRVYFERNGPDYLTRVKEHIGNAAMSKFQRTAATIFGSTCSNAIQSYVTPPVVRSASAPLFFDGSHMESDGATDVSTNARACHSSDDEPSMQAGSRHTGSILEPLSARASSARSSYRSCNASAILTTASPLASASPLPLVGKKVHEIALAHPGGIPVHASTLAAQLDRSVVPDTKCRRSRSAQPYSCPFQGETHALQMLSKDLTTSGLFAAEYGAFLKEMRTRGHVSYSRATGRRSRSIADARVQQKLRKKLLNYVTGDYEYVSASSDEFSESRSPCERIPINVKITRPNLDRIMRPRSACTQLQALQNRGRRGVRKYHSSFAITNPEALYQERENEEELQRQSRVRRGQSAERKLRTRLAVVLGDDIGALSKDVASGTLEGLQQSVLDPRNRGIVRSNLQGPMLRPRSAQYREKRGLPSPRALTSSYQAQQDTIDFAVLKGSRVSLQGSVGQMLASDPAVRHLLRGDSNSPDDVIGSFLQYGSRGGAPVVLGNIRASPDALQRSPKRRTKTLATGSVQRLRNRQRVWSALQQMSNPCLQRRPLTAKVGKILRSCDTAMGALNDATIQYDDLISE